jgi:sulfite exporter TauE/SafE
MIPYTAFILGLMGSLHCIGMCGAIALALPVPPDADRRLATLVYNLGRILTYSTIGFAFGFVGQMFVLAGFQQVLSIGAGIIILIFVFLPLITKRRDFISSKLTHFISSQIRSKFATLLKEHSYSSLFLIGVLNGLLPCGLLYVALAGATATGNVFSGSIYMALFGLGTTPVMLTIGYFRHRFTLEWRSHVRKLVPVSISLVAILLIIRGMNLGIPYLSPKVVNEKHTCCTLKRTLNNRY